MKRQSHDLVRTRFAPSPTGHLHIGGVRTALFNWLYAKKTGGTFILRIEDTDTARHQENTIEPIFDSLRWLGINWDEGPGKGGDYGPYRQSERTHIYQDYAQRLLDDRKAYYCFCSPEELKEKRDAAAKKGLSFKYDRKCFGIPLEESRERIKNGEPSAIRILAPDDGTIEFDDMIYGKIKVNTENLDDYVIMRSNGLPTYNFSVAVDDALMEITDVIRGEDHLSNTPKQILVYRALGFSLPGFIHLPMILGKDGSKLSKRHGAVSVGFYREEGFLEEAMVNYLALLGWSYDEKTTIFSVPELIEKFSLEGIGKKPARFDYDKLLWMNGYYIRTLPAERIKPLIEKRVRDFLENADRSRIIIKTDEISERIDRIMPLISMRIKTISESISRIYPFFISVEYNEQLKEYFKNKEISAQNVLEKTIDSIKEIGNEEDFNSSVLEEKIHKLCEDLDIGIRKLTEVLRIALWADKVSPPLFETMAILGKDETLKRLAKYLKAIDGK